jgi:CBS domain-containing protein
VHGENLPALPVSEIMTRGVVSVAPDDPLDVVIDRFGDQRVRRLLVIDNHGLLHGIIAWADIAPHVPDRAIGRTVTEVVERP